MNEQPEAVISAVYRNAGQRSERIEPTHGASDFAYGSGVGSVKTRALQPRFSPRTDSTPYVALRPEVFVIGYHKRPGLILPYLWDQNYTLHIGNDYPITNEIPRMLPCYNSGSPFEANYQVFRSHQDAMKKFIASKSEIGLFFEDDAVPNTPEWVSIVNAACDYFPRNVDILSLYGRSFERSNFSCVAKLGDREVLQLTKRDDSRRFELGGLHHVYGSLAYLLRKPAAKTLARIEWGGIPCDVDFWDSVTTFQFVNPSPFDHDRRQGSLLFPASKGPSDDSHEYDKHRRF